MRVLDVRGLPSTFWTLWVGTLINRLGTFVAPFLALYLTRELGFSTSQTGLIISVYGLGAIGSSLVGGTLADRIGRRPTMLIGLFGGGAMMICLGATRDARVIPPVIFTLALLGEMYRPAMSAMVADIVPEKDHLRAYGLVYWAVNLGFAIASVVAGFVARRGFLPLFLIDGATTIAFGAIIWWRVSETRRTVAPSVAERTPFSAPFRDTVFMAFSLLLLGFGLAFNHFGVSMPITMTAKGLLPEDYGMAMATNGLLIVVLQPLASRHLAALRPARVLAVAAVLTGIGLSANALAQTTLHFSLAVAVWTLGEIAMVPVLLSIVAELAPVDARGRYQGVFAMVGGLGGLLAPSVGGVVLERAGATWLWMGCGGLCVVLAFGYLALEGPLERRRAEGRAAAMAVGSA